jgi:hypothetical protein
MLRAYLISFLFIAALLAGCSQTAAAYPNPETEVSKSSLPSLDGEWTIKMTHSGGIMGLLRSIEISSNGKYTVTDERSNQTVSGELAAEGLTKLMDVISSSEYIPSSGHDGWVCADCFIYDLEIHGSDSNLTIQLNDISLPESGMAPVVRHLRGLIDSALK